MGWLRLVDAAFIILLTGDWDPFHVFVNTSTLQKRSERKKPVCNKKNSQRKPPLFPPLPTPHPKAYPHPPQVRPLLFSHTASHQPAMLFGSARPELRKHPEKERNCQGKPPPHPWDTCQFSIKKPYFEEAESVHARTHKKTFDMDGRRYSPDDPCYRLGPVQACKS